MTFTNEGRLDRAIRILAGIVLGVLAWITQPGSVSTILIVIGAVWLVTGLLGWSAEYALFGISTRRKVGA